MGDAAPRFIADVMLGKLARWLRILGYDVAYDPRADDEQLVRQAVAEGRTLLTKDRRLVERWRKKLRQHGYLLLASDDWREQLRQTVHHFRLDTHNHRLTRCPDCNGVLEAVDKEAVRYRVPFFVFAHYDRFARCQRCGKVYWAGSHYERISTALDELLRETP
ncbi:hypothetical protein HRbin17_02040 [bacterium HR17]|jgi:uncharacterized protein with PIN domain|uniref:Mut7-C RNAse domain-containing protein n=1 Tax=Candidatus Fervidibacter japonicus TaxID=2035412 RepID=A0A2H5XEB4_9BACT|nr:hypothetical protein HRbin17_02040 [bacterium HR17]